MIKINEKMYSLLVEQQLNNFSVIALRDTYLASDLGETCPIEARKFVYRQILRLQEKGLLSKQEGESTRDATYSKTKLFNSTQIYSKSCNNVSDIASILPKQRDSAITFLQKELQQYQVDLSSGLAESEEYKRLAKMLPELKPQLETCFVRSREKCSKLLGQITAIETLLSDNQMVA